MRANNWWGVLATGGGAVFVASSLATLPATHKPLHCNRTLSASQVVGYQAPRAARRYRVALAVVSAKEIYYQSVIKGAKAAAAQAGVRLTVVASNGFATAPQQVQQIRRVVSRGTDAIVLGPADPYGSVKAVTVAARKGIPVIAYGSMIDSSKAYQIEQDDYRQGMAAAAALARQLPGGGAGIVMGGPANATWSSRRVAGFLDGLKSRPNISVSSVVNTLDDPAQAQTAFQQAAAAHPDVKWIYVVYDFLLTPQAVPSQYKSAIWVGGALEPATRSALKQGLAKVVLADWPVSMGYIGVSEAVQKLNGTAPPRLVCVPNTVITRSMLGSRVAKLQLDPLPPAKKD